MRLPSRLLHRKADAHKGDFGHVFILAGSARFSGAAVLCAEAAMRTGAGLVTLGIPKSLNAAIIKIKPKEVMTLSLPETKEATLALAAYKKIKDFAKNIDVLAIGPGLSQNKQTQSLARKVIAGVSKPMVIDADGLNALIGHLKILPANRQILRRAQDVSPKDTERSRSAGKPATILTPHPGEMARLLGSTIARVSNKREEIAQRFSRRYKITVVLKGHRTVVSDFRAGAYINNTGNPGMSTAGSGDVLTGMIAAFLGQGLDPFSAAKYAVYLHGLAGDMAAEEKTQISLIASDIIAKISEAIKRCS